MLVFYEYFFPWPAPLSSSSKADSTGTIIFSGTTTLAGHLQDQSTAVDAGSFSAPLTGRTEDQGTAVGSGGFTAVLQSKAQSRGFLRAGITLVTSLLGRVGAEQTSKPSASFATALSGRTESRGFLRATARFAAILLGKVGVQQTSKTSGAFTAALQSRFSGESQSRGSIQALAILAAKSVAAQTVKSVGVFTTSLIGRSTSRAFAALAGFTQGAIFLTARTSSQAYLRTSVSVTSALKAASNSQVYLRTSVSAVSTLRAISTSISTGRLVPAPISTALALVASAFSFVRLRVSGPKTSPTVLSQTGALRLSSMNTPKRVPEQVGPHKNVLSVTPRVLIQVGPGPDSQGNLMTFTGIMWDDVDPTIQYQYGYDFKQRLPTGDTLASVVWTLEVAADNYSPGTDPSPNSHLSAPSFSGTTANTWLGGLIAGVRYKLIASIISVGGTHDNLFSFIRCLAAP